MEKSVKGPIIIWTWYILGEGNSVLSLDETMFLRMYFSILDEFPGQILHQENKASI